MRKADRAERRHDREEELNKRAAERESWEKIELKKSRTMMEVLES